MANWLKYVIAFASAFILMLAIRTLAFSIHGVEGNGLTPLFQSGDRLLINRCSYGLRIEGHGILPYSRLMRSPIQRGDIVAFTMPCDSVAGVFIARCRAVPGDTILSDILMDMQIVVNLLFDEVAYIFINSMRGI